MANIATNPSVETISLIAHNQVPVVTTELLAQLYGTDINNIQKNYVRNKERFVEGKHFFKVTGEELKSFVTGLKSVANSPIEVSSKTRALILWTERGAARHAKMLDTDQAWEVFEKLEDCYFTKKPQEQLALTNGQHYVVAKDGVVIYHKVLSDRTAKKYLSGVTMQEEPNNLTLLNNDTTNKVMDYIGELRNEIQRLGGKLPTHPQFDKETIVKAVVTSMVNSSRMLLSFSASTGQPCISFIPQDCWVVTSDNIANIVGSSDGHPKKTQ